MRLIGSPAVAAIVSRAAGLAGAFALSAAILRGLSKTDAGLTLLVFTLINLAVIFARFGTDHLVLREVARGHEDAAWVVGLSGLLTCLASLPAGGAVALVVFLHEGGDRLGMSLAGAAAVLPAALAVVAGAALRGLGRVSAGTWAELASSTILASLGIVAVHLSGRLSPTSAVGVIATSYTVTALWSWLLLRRSIGADVPRLTEGLGSFWRRFRASLASFFVTSLGFYLFAWLPVLSLGFFIASTPQAHTEVALYSAAARLAQFIPLVAVVQNAYLSQQFARLHHRSDLDGINRLAQRATTLGGAWSLVLAVILVVFPARLLGIFGDFGLAAPSLRVLALGGLAVTLLGPVTSLMLTCGHERAAGRYTTALVVISLPLFFVFTRWGSLGAAIAASLVSLSYALACSWTLWRDGIVPTPLPRRAR